MGAACGKWSEVAACVPTNEAGLRTRWFTVMDTAATSPFTKVTLAAVSPDRRDSCAARGAARSLGFQVPGRLPLSTCVCLRVGGVGRQAGRQAGVLFVVSSQHT